MMYSAKRVGTSRTRKILSRYYGRNRYWTPLTGRILGGWPDCLMEEWIRALRSLQYTGRRLSLPSQGTATPTPTQSLYRLSFASFSTTPAPANEKNDPTSLRIIISYITDVEGDAEYLKRYVQQSKLLCFRAVPKSSLSSSSKTFPYPEWIDFIPTSQVLSTKDPRNSASTTTTPTITAHPKRRKRTTSTKNNGINNDPQTQTSSSSPASCIETHLVYGGDVWDQGGSDLYVIRQLISLQQRYPQRVHFIMGNRDINKMRLSTELLGPLSLPLHADPPKMISLSSSTTIETTTTTTSAYLQDAPTQSIARKFPQKAYWLAEPYLMGDSLFSSSPVEHLQWILEKTMGSPRAFEHRRCELEQQFPERSIGDMDVLDSYLQSTHPITGEMGQYLAQAKLALRMGQVLFLHGALPLTDELLQNGYHPNLWDDLTFAMPWLPSNVSARDVAVESIADWLNALNAFATDRVRDWQQSVIDTSLATMHDSNAPWSARGGYAHPFRHTQLVQYGMGWTPNRKRNPTIVYNSWCTNGMPRHFFPPATAAFSAATKDFFEKCQVALICSGHQPQGDIPTPIRVPLSRNNQKMGWIWCCDTSYSGDVLYYNSPLTKEDHKNQPFNPGRGGSRSGRGMHAVSEVLIHLCGKTGEVLDAYCHGTLSDGTRYQTESLDFTTKNFGHSQSTDAFTVGTLAAGYSCIPSVEGRPSDAMPWWTRAELSPECEGDAKKYLLASGEKFKVWNYVAKCHSRVPN